MNVFAGRLLLVGRDDPRCAGEDPTIMTIFQFGHFMWKRVRVIVSTLDCLCFLQLHGLVVSLKDQTPFQNGVGKLAMQ